MVDFVNLYIKDINPALLNYEEWLDETIGLDPNYFARPWKDCLARACPSRLYIGHMTVGATYRAAQGSVGKEFRSGKLDINLIRHAEGCGGLLVAKVIRSSEAAEKLSDDVVRTQFANVEMTLTRSSSGLPICLIEKREDATTLWLPNGGNDTTRQEIERSNYPSYPAKVDAFLQTMRDEISLGFRQTA